MSVEQTCPENAKLLELLEGNLSEPELSEHASHLEVCDSCQQKVGALSSKGVFSETLRGDATAMNRIAHQTPRGLIESIKQIPMFAPDRSSSSESSELSPQIGVESIDFSADPTPGGLGRLGPYRLLRLIGSGGMGSVFLADDTRLHRQVAIKVMLPRIAADPVARERFIREAQAAASLKSEHIVRIYQVDEENNLPYLTMEYLEGQSLDELIQSNAELDVPDILHIVGGVLRGLADSHEIGLIHRDIKPGNIWMQFGKDSSPRVKILDFGLARSNVDESHLTHVDAIVGTPAFMAPEQARGEKTVDARSDLFSLGCVLYYLCTREVPFKSDTTIGTLMSLAVETPEPPCSRNAAIPLKLSQLTMRLLEKDPNNRPQTAREVLIALKEMGREMEQGIARYASVDDLKLKPEQNAMQIKNRRRALIGLSSIALAVCAIYIFSQPKPDSIAPSVLSIASMKTDTLEHKNPLNVKASEQIKGVFEQFKLQNPRFEGAFRPTMENGELVGLTISGSNISLLDSISSLTSLRSLRIEGGSTVEKVTLDLSPIQQFDLVHLGLHGGYVTTNLNALSGMPLEELSVYYSPVYDLTPLKGMPMRKLGLWSWAGSDLTPLEGMPLEEVNIGGNGKAMDLKPLAGAPIQFLCVNVSGVCDLAPLRGMPLRQLYCSRTRISDLSPVKDCPIEELMVEETLVSDISIAKSWPLKWIEFNYDLPNWWDVLKDIPSLQRIHDDPAATVLAELDPSKRLKSEADFINSIGMEFSLVPKGKTIRPKGNFDDLGSRGIEIENDFYLGRFEVTQAEWMKLMGSNPSHFSRGGPGEKMVHGLTDQDLEHLPVERVSWTDCQRFLENLNKLDEDSEWRYRLPTEAEWTYACQGGPMGENFDVQNLFYFTHATNTLLPYQANFKLCGLQRPCKVGLFAPNSLGLFDMHGNVWEWCEDLSNHPERQSRWIHGGGWSDEAERCQSSFLLEPTEPWSYYDLGFRVARVKK